jgi:alpha-galactosidase
MTKIAFIGAGSYGFTRGLVRDILTFPLLRDATFALMDIDPERLDFARRSVERIIELGGYPAKVQATLSREEALEGADAVLVTILAGSVDVWQHDILIPEKFGIDINVGDTRGPSGIFRALRTIPVMLSITKDMERLCPDATMLNYTNPMAMLCRAMQHTSPIQVTGLCHSVQGTAMMLAKWIGAPYEEITYTCAGINHMAWYLKYEWNGKDAYPLLRTAVEENQETYNEEIVRNEMFLALDYYVTESSGHNSEYNWWFRKRPDLIEKYCTHGTGWNPGLHRYILNEYRKREGTWKDDAQTWYASDSPISLERGHEYAAYIINALQGGEPFEFNGNVRNDGLVDNLPQGACVEVPVWASKKGLSPVRVGSLPPQCAMLTNLSAEIEEMAVEGSLTGNPRMIYQAIAHDPLTASVLSLCEIKEMVNAMFAQNKEYLPQFKNFTV